MAVTTDKNMVDVRIRVLATEERNGRRVLRTDAIPKELEPYAPGLEMKCTGDSNVEIYLFYEPFLGLVDALEGESVPFRLCSDELLHFAPTPDLYLGEPSVTLSFGPSLVHRFYKLNKRKSEPSLLWCVGLTTDKKKEKAILLDVAKLCASTLPLNQEPSQTQWPGSELYSRTKLSKLSVAIPSRTESPHPSPSSSPRPDESDSIRPSAGFGRRKQLTTRLKVKLHEYEDEMVNITTSGLTTV